MDAAFGAVEDFVVFLVFDVAGFVALDLAAALRGAMIRIDVWWLIDDGLRRGTCDERDMWKFDDKNEVDDEMMKMRKCEEFESKQNEN